MPDQAGPLPPRKKKILRAVVDDYIHNAEPVGSKALAERWGLGLSSATIRNEMAELEALGYLEQPHTSAGRIPSPLGYRLYVDELMQTRALTDPERETIDNALRTRVREFDRLIAQAGRMISDLTQYTAYTVLPPPQRMRFKRFELLNFDAYAFIAIVVSETGEVKNQMLRSVSEVVEAALQQLGQALNALLCGLSPEDINAEISYEVERLAGEGTRYWPSVLIFLQEQRESPRHYAVAGEARLLTHPEFRGDVARAQRTLEYLTEASELVGLTPPEGDASGVRVIIGPENVSEALQGTSVVLTTYPLGDNLQGVIGLVGPTRMDYAQLTARLSYFAGSLGKLLVGESINTGGSCYAREKEEARGDTRD